MIFRISYNTIYFTDYAQNFGGWWHCFRGQRPPSNWDKLGRNDLRFVTHPFQSVFSFCATFPPTEIHVAMLFPPSFIYTMPTYFQGAVHDVAPSVFSNHTSNYLRLIFLSKQTIRASLMLLFCVFRWFIHSIDLQSLWLYGPYHINTQSRYADLLTALSLNIYRISRPQV